MEFLISLLGAGIGAGLMSIVLAYLQHKWAKQEAHDDRVDALVDAEKVMMIYMVTSLGKEYIRDGQISLNDKDTLKEMHKTYKALGGNGHLDTIMNEVDRLKVVGE